MSTPSRNVVRERLVKAKREAVEAACGKGESWATKLLNGESGVRLDDLPALLAALDLKAVDVAKFCVDHDLAKSYETIAAHAMRAGSLFDEESE